MRYLLDTHVLLWFHDLNPSMSQRALGTIKDKGHECWFSQGSVWELAIKLSLNKIKLSMPLQEYVDHKVVRSDFRILPIEISHLARLEELPWHHRDPFDRLLVAQAQAENLTLITADRQLKPYPVEILW